METVMLQDTRAITTLKDGYIQEIKQKGIIAAHYQRLKEIKNQLDQEPYYHIFPQDALKYAVQVHTRLIFMAAFEDLGIPPIAELDRLFIEVFGEKSKSVILKGID